MILSELQIGHLFASSFLFATDLTTEETKRQRKIYYKIILRRLKYLKMLAKHLLKVGKVRIKYLNNLVILLLSVWLSSTVLQITSLSFRPFDLYGNSSLNATFNSSCSAQTVKATYGCPCSLIGQKCFNYGTTCKSSNSTTNKPGRCLCGNAFASTVGRTCRGTFQLNATAGLTAPLDVSGCLGAYAGIPGLNLTVQTGFGAKPIQFLLAVLNSSNSDSTRYINVDANTLEVYLEPFAPASTTVQFYSVLGIDRNNETSNPLVFGVQLLAAPPDQNTCTGSCP